METWLPIVGYEGFYEVSDTGRVRTIAATRYHRKFRILQPHETSGGYYQTHLSKNTVRIQVQTHRLVALAFVPNTDGKPYVNHKDGNKKNNCPSNLEWVTASENLTHAYQTGLLARGEGRNTARLTARQVLRIRAARGRISQRTLAKKYGVGKSTINALMTRQSWKHI